jgi:hypothetical protein
MVARLAVNNPVWCFHPIILYSVFSNVSNFYRSCKSGVLQSILIVGALFVHIYVPIGKDRNSVIVCLLKLVIWF